MSSNRVFSTFDSGGHGTQAFSRESSHKGVLARGILFNMSLARLALAMGLSTAAAENMTASSAYPIHHCSYPKTKVGSIHAAVYHIYWGGSGHGVSEKNAATAVFDYEWAGRSINREYYKGGYIAKVHVGVTQWGPYADCDHAAGSHVYVCKPRQPNPGNLAGVLPCGNPQGPIPPVLHDDPLKMENYAYSFPAAGKDKTWSEYDGKKGPCGMIRIKAKCLYNHWAKAGTCPKGCDGIDSHACAQCSAGVPNDKKLQIFLEAIDGGKCHRYETAEEELQEIQREELLMNATDVIV